MDTIHFKCSSCGKRLKVNGGNAGKRVRCPGCGAACAVPFHWQAGAAASRDELPELWDGEPEAGGADRHESGLQVGRGNVEPVSAEEKEDPVSPLGIGSRSMDWGIISGLRSTLAWLSRRRDGLIALWLLSVLVLLFGLHARLGRIERDISSVRYEVVRMKIYIGSDVSSIRSDVSSIESDVSSMKSDVSSIESDVSSIESDVSSIESDVSHIKIHGVQIEE